MLITAFPKGTHKPVQMCSEAPGRWYNAKASEWWLCDAYKQLVIGLGKHSQH
jgi:hypothetical protein